jgi:molybdate transport system ATP-binding protein
MKKLTHVAVYVQRDADREWLINAICSGNLLGQDLSLAQLNGAVYSNVTLKRFIDEELRHDHFEIDMGSGNILATSSSGEQRRALLQYIINKDPGYIILDNVFESLDLNARGKILLQLAELASTTLMIQILDRKRDLLPFVETIYILEHNVLTSKQRREEFQPQAVQSSTSFFNLAIPPPLQGFPPVQDPLVQLNGISVQFSGRPILKDINWQINTGEFWQLKGPNGSGKSTLLAMITGDSPKAYGQNMLLFGKRKGSGETVWSIKEKIGYFAPTMVRDFERQDSVEKMIVSGIYDSVGLYIKPSDRQLKLADDWLNLVGMYEIRKQPFRLSPPGQQRMVLIARAMIKHPPLLILDEPASGLDDEAAVLFTALINKIASETNTSIIYVSHMEEPGLSPQHVFELVAHPDGSTGHVLR